MIRAGFTLVELLVALVVLEVGLLGVVGTLFLAAGLVRETRSLEEAVAAMERVYEEVRVGVAAASGTRPLPHGEIRWAVTAEGLIEVSWWTEGAEPRATVHGAVPAQEGGR